AELCFVNCHNFAGRGIPFGIIFGGTDLNEDVNQEEKIEVMGKVLEEARFAVAFTESMKEMAQTQWVGVYFVMLLPVLVTVQGQRNAKQLY
ncbi:hypothetical protein MC885_014200, partial [Smutsia gigantea]